MEGLLSLISAVIMFFITWYAISCTISDGVAGRYKDFVLDVVYIIFSIIFTAYFILDFKLLLIGG